MALTLNSPEDFLNLGLTVPDQPTLVGEQRQRELERYLTKLAASIPEMAEGVSIGSHAFKPLVPRPYQLRYAAMAAMRRINIFGYEAGSGKTAVAILAIYAIFGRKRFERGGMLPGMIHILSTPISLELTWLKELTRCGLGPWAQVITSENDLLMSQAPILIYSYDFLKRQTRRGLLMKKAKQVRYRQEKGVWQTHFVGEPMVKAVRYHRKPVMLVCDEIHRCRSGSERTKAVRELRKGCRWFLGLTGTPIDGWIDHLGAIFALAYGENTVWWPYTVAGFDRTFTHSTVTGSDYATGETTGRTRRIVAPGVPQHLLPKFYDTVGRLMHRLLFEDAEVSPFVEFPEADHQLLLLEPSQAHKTAYKDLYLSIRTELESALNLLDRGRISRLKARDTVLPLLMLLRQLSAHPWELPEPYKRFEQPGSVKLDTLVRLVREFADQGRKVVIFTNFIPTGGRIQTALRAAGIRSHRIYATDVQAKPQSLTRIRRTELVQEFLDDDSTALVANLRLLAESLTLSEAASAVIHFDHTWESVLWEQGNKRVVRPGQVFNQVPVIDLVLSGTIERYVYDYMQSKLRANQQAVDRDFTSVYDVSDTLQVTEMLIRDKD